MYKLGNIGQLKFFILCATLKIYGNYNKTSNGN